MDLLRSVYADFTERELPEVVDLADAERTIAQATVYIGAP
jgi:hypothetical protein